MGESVDDVGSWIWPTLERPIRAVLGNADPQGVVDLGLIVYMEDEPSMGGKDVRR